MASYIFSTVCCKIYFLRLSLQSVKPFIVINLIRFYKGFRVSFYVASEGCPIKHETGMLMVTMKKVIDA